MFIVFLWKGCQPSHILLRHIMLLLTSKWKYFGKVQVGKVLNYNLIISFYRFILEIVKISQVTWFGNQVKNSVIENRKNTDKN